MARRSIHEDDQTHPSVVEATPRWVYWTMTAAIMLALMVLFGLYGCYEKGLDHEAAEGGDVVDNIIILSIAGFALANVFFWAGRWMWLRCTRQPVPEPPLAMTPPQAPEEPDLNRSAEKRRQRHARRRRR